MPDMCVQAGGVRPVYACRVCRGYKHIPLCERKKRSFMIPFLVSKVCQSIDSLKKNFASVPGNGMILDCANYVTVQRMHQSRIGLSAATSAAFDAAASQRCGGNVISHFRAFTAASRAGDV